MEKLWYSVLMMAHVLVITASAYLIFGLNNELGLMGFLFMRLLPTPGFPFTEDERYESESEGEYGKTGIGFIQE